MNNNDLNAIANEMIVAFFSDVDDTELLNIAHRHGISPVGKIFDEAIERAVDWLESDDIEAIDALTHENKARLINQSLARSLKA